MSRSFKIFPFEHASRTSSRFAKVPASSTSLIRLLSWTGRTYVPQAQGVWRKLSLGMHTDEVVRSFRQLSAG